MSKDGVTSRRSCLRTLAGVSALSLAGCTGNVLGPSAAQTSISDSVPLLQECDSYLIEKATALEKQGATSIEFDKNYIQTRVDQARPILREGSENATESEAKTIAALNSAADTYVPASTLVSGLIAVDTEIEELNPDTIRDAEAPISRMKSLFEPLPGTSDTILKEIREIDAEALSEVGLTWDESQAKLNELSAIVEDVGDMLDMMDYLVKGADALQTGASNIQDDQYAAAEVEFSFAKSCFESADKALARIESGDYYQSDEYRDWACAIPVFRDASDALMKGARAGKNGNWILSLTYFDDAGSTLENNTCVPV